MRKNKLRMGAIVMMAVMMLSCIPCVAGKNVKVDAATANYTEKLDISKYKDNAPKPSDASHKDWVFAGWFNDENCTDFVTSDEKTEATGEKYAKFVSADVLSVKCQILNGTTKDSEKTSMRLVTTVDGLDYTKVGFDIAVGEKTADIEMTTVYKKITANDGEVVFEYNPTDFDSNATYFATVTLTNIPKSGFEKGIFIKPYWVTVDGTKVYGVERYARVEDEWENIVNVPVRVYTDCDVAAGHIKVTYDKDKYTYAGTENGDIGDVFDEMYVADDSKGTVSCVGNTEKAENTKADGMIVNLRFKAISGTITSETFSVTDESFANEDEEFVYTAEKEFNISDVNYKAVGK